MKLYLDSAQVSTWAIPAGCPPIAGVTTNPSLVLQAGLPVTLASYEHLLQAAAERGMSEIMLQLPQADADEARRWQERLHRLATDRSLALTIKLPCRSDWLPAIDAMRAVDQPFLLTGLSNAVQLLWAQSLGAAYVAPYVGRLAADGRDVWSLMDACVRVQANGPVLLAASIKSAEVFSRLLASGAGAVTLPPASLVAWAGDALTDTAIAQFERDIRASQSLAAPEPSPR